jgi:glycosyltransferase involved in cell wall biosynthesis
MTYFDRAYQLARTLASIGKTAHPLYEVVIVDDSSPASPPIAKFHYPIHLVRTREKRWVNPEPAYNTGLLVALDLEPDVIVVQNAECYHVGDVISRAATVGAADWLTFAAFSLDQRSTFMEHNIDKLTAEHPHPVHDDGVLGWYNHPEHRPVGYDFCAAARSEVFQLLNGYDERFSAGCGYGDDNLLHRVRRAGLGVQFVTEPYVAHQWHYGSQPRPDKAALVAKNAQLHQLLKTEGSVKAHHKYTKDLR